MKALKEKILKIFEENPKKSYPVKALTQILGMKKSKKFKKLVQALAELEREGRLDLLPDGSFQLGGQPQLYVGTFMATDRGFGFVAIEDFEEDVFISPADTQGALQGDTVEIEITKAAEPWNDQAAEGRVLNIEKRQITQLVGVFVEKNTDPKTKDIYGTVQPNDRKLQKYTIQLTDKGLHPVAGEVLLADIIKYPDHDSKVIQVVGKKILGHVNDPGVEITAIAYKHDIHTEFPEEVLEEIKHIPEEVRPEERQGRLDLRDEYTVTIDGADAKDLDDAISIQKLKNGNFKLGVHIADVSYYVKEGTALDEEAYARGVSSYLVDRVIPMLPPKLSNGICSLNPDVERLTMSCIMEYNDKGQLVDYEIAPSVIRSNRRLTYRLVNEILSDNPSSQVLAENEKIVPFLKQMGALHEILERKRHQQGAISFETPEVEFELDEQGKPLAIHLREREIGERLIESFMLAANETIAMHYVKKDVPFLYRVHEHPDRTKMQRFITFASRFGLQVRRVKDQVSPKILQQVLEQVEGEPAEQVISMLMLRSMQQAHYDVQPLGHYGLATEYYSHFTAPIRRYPDLILHRLIHRYSKKTSKKELKKWEKKLPEIAEYTSAAERRAIDAEREVDDLKMAEYMEDKIGERYEGLIVSITNFGMFVQLPNAVEGLVHVSDMDDDYYEFIEEHMMMVGKRSGKVYKLGDTVNIEVAQVNVKQYEIDFKLLHNKKQNHTKHKQKKARHLKDNQTKRNQSAKRNQKNKHRKRKKKHPYKVRKRRK